MLPALKPLLAIPENYTPIKEKLIHHYHKLHTRKSHY